MGKQMKLLCLLCSVIYGSNVFPQTRIPLKDEVNNKELVTIDIIESNQYVYKARLAIHGVNDDLITTGKGEFHKLSLSKGGYLNNIGEPALPILTQLIAIPPESSAKVSISDEKWISIEIGTIYPSQVPYIEDGKTNDFCINDSVYNKPFTPPTIQVSNETKWRGVRNVNIVLCPFKYFPKERRLDILTDAIVQVDFSTPKLLQESRLQEVEDNYKLFANKIYKDQKTETAKSSSSNYDYLIIVGNGFDGTSSNGPEIIMNSTKMDEFKTWKAMKGYKTKVVSTETTGTSPTSIKSYIERESENGIQYVLLVGDVNNINTSGYNTSIYSTISSDYWYGCLSDENRADIPIGRFSISSLAEFGNIVDKTIKYEKSYNSTNNTLLIAHYENAPQGYQLCCDQILGGNYTEPMSFVKAYGAYGCTNDSVINYINNGTHIVNYRGHGGVGLWGNPYWNNDHETFDSNQINYLNNGTNSIYFSVACLTGNISDTCLLEIFTRSKKGAVAFLGSSYSTETSSNDEYNKQLFAKLLNNGLYNLGEVNLATLIECINNSNNYSTFRDIAFSSICGGDPTLEIWTSTPQSIGNVELTTNNGSITINTGTLGNCTISIVSMNGDLLQKSTLSGSSYTFVQPADKFYICVNKHNYYPKIIYYDSVSNSIVNTKFDYDAYYLGTPLEMHIEAASNDEDEGVVVKSGNKLCIKNGSGGVTIQDGFECEQGAVFEIK